MSELSDLNETDGSNTLFSGVSIAEGCPPGNVNNWMRAFAGATRRWFKSSLFRLRDSTDQTKLLAFDLSGITTATTRTLKVPNGSGVIYSDASPMGGFRNKIINGDFAITQRGGPFSAAGYTLDRWKLVPGTGSTNSIQRTNTASGELRNIGPYSLLWARSVAGSTSTALQQYIEGVEVLSDGKATATIWANANANTELLISMQQYFGSGGSPSSNVTVPVASGSSQTLSVTTTMQKFNVVFDVPSISGMTLGTNDDHALVLNISRLHSSTNPTTTVRLRHVSVVEGDATTEADPFSPRHPQQELALCQRYCQPIPWGTVGRVTTTTRIWFFVPFATPMRAEPTTSVSSSITLAASNGVSSSSISPVNISAQAWGTTGGRVEITGWSGPLTVGEMYALSGGGTGFIYLSAEL